VKSSFLVAYINAKRNAIQTAAKLVKRKFSSHAFVRKTNAKSHALH